MGASSAKGNRSYRCLAERNSNHSTPRQHLAASRSPTANALFATSREEKSIP